MTWFLTGAAALGDKLGTILVQLPPYFRNRSPRETTVRAWSEQVPDNFRFALKLNRKITHEKRLKEVEEGMTWFLTGAAALGDKLGTILVQLPPYFRKDLALLRSFLEK